MVDSLTKPKRPEPPCFAFWLEEEHVLISGNERPKSALMVFRAAAAMLSAWIERSEGSVDEDLVWTRAYLLLRRGDALFLKGQSDRTPDAIVSIRRDGVDLQLAKLLTLSELEKLATVAVTMLAGLNRPGAPAIYLDKRECAHMLGLIVSAQKDGPQIPWTDPFEAEES